MNNLSKSFVLQAFTESPWAILPSKLMALEEIVMRHVTGEKLNAEEIQARIQDTKQRPPEQRVSSVAVLPLFGTIFPRAGMFSDISGGTSSERFGNQFMELIKDPTVSAIVIDVDSPGGSVYGVAEVAQKIFDARGTKPVVAVANHQMASAAYWIGTAADEVVVTPSGDVGSIGVFATHKDMSEALAQAGVKVSLIRAGKYKAEGNPYEPLSEEARTSIQDSVNEVYDEFVNAVALHRGVKSAIVKDSFGEGRMVSARQAVALGMADRIGTLDETIARMFSLNGNTLKGNVSSALLNDQEEPAPIEHQQSAADVERSRQVQSLREFIDSKRTQ